MGIEVEKDESGNSYVPVPVGKLHADKKLVAPIFLKIHEKFIKLKNSEDELESEKLDYFIQQNLKHVFIKMNDLAPFMDWIKDVGEKAVNEIVAEVGEDHRSLVEKSVQIREKVFDTFTDMEMDSGIAEILQSQVKEFIEEAKELKTSKSVLVKMLKHNSSIADHSLNTANVAVFMAMVLGHGNYQVLEDIYMGSLFHDYAKLKISPEVLENQKNQKYNQAIQDHPRKGAVAVSKLESVRESVARITEQHHECFNGSGFPKGLKGDEIFGLASIVSMANIFDNVVVENKNKSKKEKYRSAIKVIEYDKGKQFCPEMAEKVVTALKLAYGEFYQPAKS
jgi:HD-GYP domain-containing protein (c-di-GMP phosphodiesterase class II)